MFSIFLAIFSKNYLFFLNILLTFSAPEKKITNNSIDLLLEGSVQSLVQNGTQEYFLTKVRNVGMVIYVFNENLWIFTVPGVICHHSYYQFML